MRRAPKVTAFAVEPRAVELSWSRLPATEMVFELGGTEIEVDATPPDWYRRAGRVLPPGQGGPGAITFGGLEPGTTYEATVRGRSVPRRPVARATTMPEGPGRLLARFATVGDCHIGQRRLTERGRLRDPDPLPPGLLPYPERSLRAAVQEATAWGAQWLVAKGDITEAARPGEAARAAELLRESGLPAYVVLGNHDLRGGRDVLGELAVPGVHASREVMSVDLPGARLVLGHTPIRGSHGGRLGRSHMDALVEAVESSPSPAVLLVHHPLERLPFHTHYPPGVAWRESAGLARRLVATGRPVVLLAGHTHRNRRYRVGGLDTVEVGSTKDYPGVWAGYSVYERGISQVLYRVSHPDVVAWTEMTGESVYGIWRRWSPGRLGDRCWTIDWTDRTPGRSARRS
jgi:hypothetical protein